MPKKNHIFLFLIWCALWMVGFSGCKNREARQDGPSIDSLQALNLSSLGDSISTAAQGALMKQLMQAMQSKGPGYAVNFCSEQAIPITDSLSQSYGCDTKRVALRNRNPANALTETDKVVYDGFERDLANGVSLQSQVVAQQGTILFYKPIVLAMPACLKCHGNSNELDPAAYAAIQTLYPEDKAIGFGMGELRGMWRLAFPR